MSFFVTHELYFYFEIRSLFISFVRTFASRFINSQNFLT